MPWIELCIAPHLPELGSSDYKPVIEVIALKLFRYVAALDMLTFRAPYGYRKQCVLDVYRNEKMQVLGLEWVEEGWRDVCRCAGEVCRCALGENDIASWIERKGAGAQEIVRMYG